MIVFIIEAPSNSPKGENSYIAEKLDMGNLLNGYYLFITIFKTLSAGTEPLPLGGG
jgi:hypothetical protein